MKHRIEALSVKQRLAAVIASGALAASTVGAPFAAFAVDASAGEQSGVGVTDVTVQLANGGDELGGTEDAKNPDGNHDDIGDNIAFTVPASINFVAKANGTLIGPDASDTFIENESVFAIHASSMKVDQANGWTIVESVTGDSTANIADFTFGPTGDPLNAHDYLTQKAVGDATQWNMTSKRADPSVDDRVQLSSGGHIANVDKAITAKTKIATIHTYVTQGKVA